MEVGGAQYDRSYSNIQHPTSNMNRINWINFLILPVAVALMIAAWIEPWLLWAVRATGHAIDRPAPSALAWVAVLLISTYVTRFVLGSQTRHPRRWTLVTGAVLIIGVTWANYGAYFPWPWLLAVVDWRNSISPESIVLIVTAILWWRGIALGRTRPIMDDGLERTFFNGLVALALLLFLNNFTKFVSADAMLATVLTFFATALSALTLVSLENARQRQREQSGPWLRTHRPWLVTIVAVVAIVLLGALAITGIASPESLRDVIDSLRPNLAVVGEFLARAITTLFTFMLYLISPLLPLLEAIARLLMTGLLGVLNVIHQLGVEINQLQAEQDVNNFLNSPTFAMISRGTALVIFLFVLALIAVWMLRRSGLLSRKNLDETHESIASRELLLNQLRNWLNRWRARPGTSTSPPFLPLFGDDPRIRVRRAYQQWLAWAQLNDRARKPGETPVMFAAAFTHDRPDSRSAIDTLTQAYERARYAADTISPDEACSAETSLVSLQSASVIKSTSTEDQAQ